MWAAVVGITAGVWFGNAKIGGIMATALMVNLVVAALAGALLPITLRKLGIDPALAGTVVLTTITDIVGFMTFLGLATLLLSQLL
jgi:magnesium transporter